MRNVIVKLLMLCGAICALVSTSVAQIRLGLQTGVNNSQFSKSVSSRAGLGFSVGAFIELGGESLHPLVEHPNGTPSTDTFERVL